MAHVHEFWERNACGEVYAQGGTERERLAAHARTRYEIEPYLRAFARFEDAAGLDVLEIGVGMGADHLAWADAAPRSLVGVDLTSRALVFTRRRLALNGKRSCLLQADAEQLPLADASCDLVYSWGVLHHSPNTAAAVNEVHRVLRPGGRARVMVYHRQSIVGYLLWARYALAAGRPFRSLDDVYARHLESPGTKAYSADEAQALFGAFRDVRIRPQLSFADLLSGETGARHGGPWLARARRWWPRAAIQRAAPGLGLYLLVDAVR